MMLDVILEFDGNEFYQMLRKQDKHCRSKANISVHLNEGIIDYNDGTNKANVYNEYYRPQDRAMHMPQVVMHGMYKVWKELFSCKHYIYACCQHFHLTIKDST